jgi:hypothetical protein
MQTCNMDERTNEERLRASIEELARANTLLTLQNEKLKANVLLLMNDIDVLNSIIKEKA